MTLSNTLTTLMDSARKHFEVKQKLSIPNLINLFNPNPNLLTGAKDFSGSWERIGSWKKEDEKYRGLTVYSKSTAWDGLGQYYDSKPNTTYTFSFYAKASKPTDRFMDIFTLPSEDWNSPVIAWPIYANVPLTTDWKRFSWTITTTGGGKIFPSVCSINSDATIYVCGYKLEEGSLPTPLTEVDGVEAKTLK